MASRVLDHFNDVSNCPICKEILKEPRLILCGHTFCLGCLQSMQIKGLGTRGGDQVLECPMCKKISRIPKGGTQNFPPNVMAIQVQTAVDEALQTMRHTFCDACSRRAPDHVFCRTCEVNLCLNCGNSHRTIFTKHDIVEDLGNVPTKRCSKHTGKMTSFYCSTCFVAMCPLCATNSHAGSSHRVIPLEEAKDNFVEQVKDKIGALKEKRKKQACAQDKHDRMRRNAVDNYALQKGLVESAAMKRINTIKKEAEELKKRIQELHDRNIKMLDECEEVDAGKSMLLDDTLKKAENLIQDIQISDFPDKSLEMIDILEEAEDTSSYDETTFCIQEYTFNNAEQEKESLGSITVPHGESYIDLEIQKTHTQELTEEQEALVEMRMVKRSPSPIPRPPGTLQLLDQTRRKEYHLLDTPMLVGSFVLDSGVLNIPIKMIGVGLLQNNDVICAYNTNRMGQVVLCTQPDKHQVLYHRRKGISAFALYKDEECGVVLEDDCNISRLILNEIPSDREVTCMTHKISCRASNIGALAFNLEGVLVISDSDKNCLTGIDRQSKRPFNLNGNINEDKGSFSTTKGLASGPLGEIILYDGEKRRVAVFSRNTRFEHYINLPEMSSDCSITCDELGVLYVADAKQNKVLKLSMTGSEQPVEILNASHGLNSPTCLCIQGRSLAVANVKSFSEGEIRVFEFAEIYQTHV